MQQISRPAPLACEIGQPAPSLPGFLFKPLPWAIHVHLPCCLAEMGGKFT